MCVRYATTYTTAEATRVLRLQALGEIAIADVAPDAALGCGSKRLTRKRNQIQESDQSTTIASVRKRTQFLKLT